MSARRYRLGKRCEDKGGSCAGGRCRTADHSYSLFCSHRKVRWSVPLWDHCANYGIERPETKQQIDALAADIYAAILAGTYVRKPPKPAAPEPSAALSFDAALASFVRLKFNRQRGPDGKTWVPVIAGKKAITTADDEASRYARFGDVLAAGSRLGAIEVSAITEDLVELIFAQLAGARSDGTKRKYALALRRFFRWAAGKKLIIATPIGDEADMTYDPERPRTRRVKDAELADILEAANEGRRGSTKLAALIIAAIDLGARLGELLALRWRDIDVDRATVFIAALEEGGRKIGVARYLGLSRRLLAVLRYLRLRADGSEAPGHWYIFGDDETGAKQASYRKAWETCVLRAHKHEPRWTEKGGLDAASRARLADIGLHFHDLRHEAALRWLEGDPENGVPGLKLHAIKDLLGHVSIATTARYLNIRNREAVEAFHAMAAAQPEAPITLRAKDRAGLVTLGAAGSAPPKRRHTASPLHRQALGEAGKGGSRRGADSAKLPVH